MNDTSLVSVQHLSRHYGNLTAVADVNFELAQGEVLGFLGPNGAGKSTTMQIITGNLAPSVGHIRICGIDLLEHPKLAKAEIGYLPEQPPLYRDLSVDEYLRYCARLRRIGKIEIKSALDLAKQRCGLTEVGRRLIGNLSKGYQQRVGIAQAILHSPQVIILDEPTVGLDPIQIREIRQLITELGKSHGIILSTHILPEVQATCNRVQIIHNGRLVFTDTAAGLDARMSATALVARFGNPPELSSLRALPNVTDTTLLEDGRVRLDYSGDSPAEALVEQAVANAWRLQELTTQRHTLEQIFIELTAGDTPGQNSEAAA